MKKTLSIIATILSLSVAHSIAQNVSDILNAIQERHKAIETLRKDQFEYFVKQYKEHLELGGDKFIVPGQEGDWVQSYVDIESKYYLSSNSTADIESLRVEMTELTSKWWLLFGGPGAFQYLVDDEVKYTYELEYAINIVRDPNTGEIISESVDLPLAAGGEWISLGRTSAASFFLTHENSIRTLISQGSISNIPPSYPTPQQIIEDTFAVNKWYYQITIWLGQNIEKLLYVEEPISWKHLEQYSGTQITEDKITELNKEQYCDIINQASLIIDKIKRNFWNIQDDEIVSGNQYSDLIRFDELSMPSLGTNLSKGDVANLAYLVSRLNKMTYFFEISNFRQIRSKEGPLAFIRDFEDIDFENLMPGIYTFPRERTDFSNSFQSYEFALFISEKDMSISLDYICNAWSTGDNEYVTFPIWSVPAAKGNKKVHIFSRVLTDGPMSGYTPSIRDIPSWEVTSVRYENSEDFRNARFTGGEISDAFPQNVMIAEFVSVWDLELNNDALELWNQSTIQSPNIQAGHWHIPTSGPYRFALHLGSSEVTEVNNELRSNGMLVIKPDEYRLDSFFSFTYPFLSYHESLEFVGDKDNFKLTYLTGDQIPTYSTEELGSDIPLSKALLRGIKKPRLHQVKGFTIDATITELSPLKREIKLTYKDGTEANTITIENINTNTWRFSESKGLKRVCTLENLTSSSSVSSNSITDHWKCTCSSPLQTNDIVTVSSVGEEDATDFDDQPILDTEGNPSKQKVLTTNITEGAFISVTKTYFHLHSSGPRDVIYPVMKVHVNDDGKEGFSQDESITKYRYHVWPASIVANNDGIPNQKHEGIDIHFTLKEMHTESAKALSPPEPAPPEPSN